MNFNSTSNSSNNIYYDYSDTFPLSYENDQLTNRTSDEDYFVNLNETFNQNNSDSISLTSLLTFSTPFSYIFLILIVYLILTMILLTFSLYKQRQSEIENFDFGDTDDDIEQAKRTFKWKEFLIKKIAKGDMEPLLTERNSTNQEHLQTRFSPFPLQTV